MSHLTQILTWVQVEQLSQKTLKYSGPTRMKLTSLGVIASGLFGEVDRQAGLGTRSSQGQPQPGSSPSCRSAISYGVTLVCSGSWVAYCAYFPAFGKKDKE